MSTSLRNYFPYHFYKLANRYQRAVPTMASTLQTRPVQRRISKIAVGLTVMAAVTVAERNIDPTQHGFTVEWIVLSLVALTTFLLMAKAVRVAVKFATLSLPTAINDLIAQRDEQRLLTLARGDVRVMMEIKMARDRQMALAATTQGN